MLILNKSHKNTGAETRDAGIWDPFRIMREMTGWDEAQSQRSYSYAPAFEVKETRESFVFKADLPGVEIGDVEISLTGNHLTIAGRREPEKVDENERYFSYERSFGTFSRSFTLPNGCNVDDVSADLKGGVLTVVVPKKAEVQPRRIEIGVKTRA
jgi:HSP20 family protein